MQRLLNFLAMAVVVLTPLQAVQAQLVAVDKVYTIKNVDTAHNRLAVKYLNANNEPVKEQLLVDIDGKTQVFGISGKPISWTNLHENMEIEVKGGLEAGLHIHAKTIIVKKLHS